jgi:hypothetical protein
MKPESTLRRTCETTGLAVGFLLAACLVLTPGCGTSSAKPPEPSVTTGREPVAPPRAKAGGKRDVEAYDDLRERRAKKRLAAQARG